MKKRYLTILSFCLVLGIGVVIFFNWKAETNKKEEVDYSKITERWITGTKPEIIGINWVNDDQWLLVSAKGQKLPENYYEENKSIEFETTKPVIGLKHIVLINSKYFMSRTYEYKPSFSTKYEIEIYTIGKKDIKKIKTVNMEKKVKAINENYSMDNVYTFTYDEKYIRFSVNEENERYYFRIADEEIFKESEMDPVLLEKTKENEIVPEAYKFISRTNFQDRDIVDDNGLWAVQTKPNQELGIRRKHKDNTKLKPSLLEKRYPEIKKIYENDGFGYLNYSQAPPSPEELAELLVPKGEDPWQGVILKANSSKDGEEHKIDSVEEFLKWYQPYEPSKNQESVSSEEESK
jgi:hypothetical protein